MSVQDLTNTTWRINDNITATSGYGNFDIYPSYAEDSEGNIIDNPEDYYSRFYIGYAFHSLTDITPQSNGIVWMSAIVPPALFTVGGGTDVSNPDLISWLESNATMQTSQITVDMSSLSGWSNVSAGSHTLTIKAKATGYRDSAPSTGVSFTKAASGLSLTVSYTNSTINAIQCASDESGTDAETLTITAGQSSLTVVIPANKPYVLIENADVGNNIQSSLDNCEWVASFNEWDIHYGAIIEITNTPATAVLTKTGFQ